MSSFKNVATLPQVARARRATLGVSTARFRGVETMLAASLSMGAAAIHLAAASSHVEAFGDLGLGFYWAALFQGAFALALLSRPSSRPLAQAGIWINIALIGAWAWSRTIGLPMIPGGPEPIAVADTTTVAFQIGLVSLLAIRLGVRGIGHALGLSATRLGPIARSACIVGIGAVLISTPLAMADGLTGHGHGGDGHADPDRDPAIHQPGLIEAPHAHGEATAP